MGVGRGESSVWFYKRMQHAGHERDHWPTHKHLNTLHTHLNTLHTHLRVRHKQTHTGEEKKERDMPGSACMRQFCRCTPHCWHSHGSFQRKQTMWQNGGDIAIYSYYIETIPQVVGTLKTHWILGSAQAVYGKMKGNWNNTRIMYDIVTAKGASNSLLRWVHGPES